MSPELVFDSGLILFGLIVACGWRVATRDAQFQLRLINVRMALEIDYIKAGRPRDPDYLTIRTFLERLIEASPYLDLLVLELYHRGTPKRNAEGGLIAESPSTTDLWLQKADPAPWAKRALNEAAVVLLWSVLLRPSTVLIVVPYLIAGRAVDLTSDLYLAIGTLMPSGKPPRPVRSSA